MTERQGPRTGAGRGPRRGGGTTELLRRSLARLYDELHRSSATDRQDPLLARRTDRNVWERLRREIVARMELDREQGRIAAPDRIPVLTEQTFRTLRRDLDADCPLSLDRLRVFEAVLAIGRVGGRLPGPWTQRAGELLAADPPPARRAGDGGRSHHTYLENASDRALTQAGGLSGPDAVALADVYVVRGQEEALARRLEEEAAAGEPGRPVQVVLGEPGTGKTSMLWYLATTLRGRRAAAAPVGRRTGPPSAERRRGAVLSPRLVRGEDLLDPHGGPRLLEALDASGKAQARRGRIVLLDSADLLLRAEDGRTRLRRVVELCQGRGTPLTMTCRTRDRAQLEDVLDGAPLAVSTHVDDFRFDGEVERAVTTYCRHYLPEDIRRSTADNLLAGAVRGLPVREVVARPLTLRMLVQVYDQGMDTAEIDAGLVYDTYWERRVARDRRHGAEVVADDRDLSWPAQATARLMLHDGTVALPAVELAKRLPAADAGPAGGDPAEQVAVLEGRGVLTRTNPAAGRRTASPAETVSLADTASTSLPVSYAGAAPPVASAGSEGPAGAVQFFHQTLYEYAAGRCVSQLADEAGLSYYQALEAHLTSHPDDFLRASVAEQAIVQGVRLTGAAREEATGLLLRLLASTEADLQVIAVRCYAFLPHLYVHEREQIQRYLREAVPRALAEELLAILPTRCHPAPEVVTADLADILRRHPALRQRVLQMLCRFGGVEAKAAGAVWSLLHQLCADHRGCLNRPVNEGDPPPTGCGGELCLWSWLVRLDGNSATSHGNLAARLVDVLAEHHGVWGLARMRELLALAQRDALRGQVLQCLPAIHRRRWKAEWAKLMDHAAETAARLGSGRPGRPGDSADTAGADTAGGQEILDAYWYEAAADGREPLAVLRSLAGEGGRPFDVPPPRLRGVLTRLGERLRTVRTPSEVHRLLDEAVALCAGTDRTEQVARALLPPLLADTGSDRDAWLPTDRATCPDRTEQGEGTRAAERWCAHQLTLFVDSGYQHPAARFAVAGLARLAPAHAARLVPWSPAARPSGRPGGRPWGEARCDAVWLAPGGAVRLLVPLAAAGDHQALAALERWRALEQAHHDQLVRGHDDWPRDHGGRPWHGAPRTGMHKVLHPALADHAPANHTLVAAALRRRIPPADLPWLAQLAKAAADRPDTDSAAGAKAVLTRYGPDLAAWCSDLWDRTLPCPDDNAKAAALRLWGDLVRLGAAERPTLRRQTKLAEILGDGWWQRAAVVFRHWNGLAATATADRAGDPDWAGLDAALAAAADAFPGRQQAIAPLRAFLHCRFAPLTGPDAVTAALAAARAEVRGARTTADIHACGAGFLAERLCAVDPAAAVSVTVMVAERVVRASAGRGVPHHVTRLGWKWQKPLTRLATDADPAQWHTLLAGLANGPLAVLQKALDLAAAHRRGEDLRAVAESALAAGPYRDEALAGLRDAAIRHRRTPLTEPRWPAILDPAAAVSVAAGLDA